MSRLRIAIQGFNLFAVNSIITDPTAEDLRSLNSREEDATPLEILVKKTHTAILQYSALQMPYIMNLVKDAILQSISLCNRLIDLGTDLTSLNIIGTIPMQLLDDEEVVEFRAPSFEMRRNLPALYNDAMDLSNKLFDCFIRPEIVSIQGHRDRTVLLYSAFIGDIYLINKILEAGGSELLNIPDSKGHTPLASMIHKMTYGGMSLDQIAAGDIMVQEYIARAIGERSEDIGE